jgi:hypothetical protein
MASTYPKSFISYAQSEDRIPWIIEISEGLIDDYVEVAAESMA